MAGGQAEDTNRRLGRAAQQSVKDAIVRGRKRRRNPKSSKVRATGSSENIQVCRPSSGRLDNSQDGEDKVEDESAKKRRRLGAVSTSLLGGDEEDDDSNDEWEEDVAVVNDRIAVTAAAASSKAKQPAPEEESDEEEEEEDEEEDEKAKREKEKKRMVRKMSNKARKLLTQMHCIQTYLLLSHLYNIERVCGRDSHFKAIVLSVVPPDLLTDGLPQRERLTRLLFWTRVAFAPAVDTVVLSRSHTPRPRPRLCDAKARMLRVAGTDVDVDVDLMDVLGVFVTIVRVLGFACRLVSPLQLLSVGKEADTGPGMGSGSGNGNSVIFGWAEVWMKEEGRWRAVDILQGLVICDDDPAHTLRQSAQAIMTHDDKAGIKQARAEKKKKTASKTKANERRSKRGASSKTTNKANEEEEEEREEEFDASRERRKVGQAFFAHVVAVEDGLLIDVSARYNADNAAVETKLRVAGRVFERAVASHNAARCPRSTATDNKAIETEATMRLQTDKAELEAKMRHEAIPRTVTGVQKHPLYVLERHIKKYEVIHPKHPVIGYINVGGKKSSNKSRKSVHRSTKRNAKKKKNTKKKNDSSSSSEEEEDDEEEEVDEEVDEDDGKEAIYLRKNVHLLHTRDRWERQLRKVRDGEQALKTVPSKNGIQDCIVELFGEWQTIELKVPHVHSDGTIPTSKHGNVDLWTDAHLPVGAAHVNVPFARHAARALGVPWAPAMTGFELRRRRSVPRLEGVVVSDANAEAVREAAVELERKAEERKKERLKAEALGHWLSLLRGMRAKVIVAKKYGRLTGSGMSYEQTLKMKQKHKLENTDADRNGNGDGDEKEKKKEEEDKDVEMKMVRNCKVSGHDFEEQQVDEGTGVKTCRTCGIRLTFEVL